MPAPVGHQHRSRPVNGVLARDATARPGAGREDHRVGAGKESGDFLGRCRFQIADDRFGASLLHVGPGS